MTDILFMMMIGFLAPLLPLLTQRLLPVHKNPTPPPTPPKKTAPPLPPIATAPTFAPSSSWVRPAITFGFFGFFLAVKMALGFGLLSPATYLLLLDDNTMALLSAIIAFWFGDRTRHKLSR